MSAHGLTHYIFTYPGIFLWFAIIEQFTPIPEEVALMTVGYISMHTSLNPVLCGAVSVVGLLTADNIFFYLALKGNKLSERALKKVNHKLLDKMKETAACSKNPYHNGAFAKAAFFKSCYFSNHGHFMEAVYDSQYNCYGFLCNRIYDCRLLLSQPVTSHS